mmetsp:Transcript_58404/g.156119  ORF Transcript_58404/g.156119 Transcript_58404/m.156119 type:complete len:414 (+) Transcript_58404:57-1298(+)
MFCREGSRCAPDAVRPGATGPTEVGGLARRGPGDAATTGRVAADCMSAKSPPEAPRADAPLGAGFRWGVDWRTPGPPGPLLAAFPCSALRCTGELPIAVADRCTALAAGVDASAGRTTEPSSGSANVPPELVRFRADWGPEVLLLARLIDLADWGWRLPSPAGAGRFASTPMLSGPSRPGAALGTFLKSASSRPSKVFSQFASGCTVVLRFPALAPGRPRSTTESARLLLSTTEARDCGRTSVLSDLPAAELSPLRTLPTGVPGTELPARGGSRGEPESAAGGTSALCCRSRASTPVRAGGPETGVALERATRELYCLVRCISSPRRAIWAATTRCASAVRPASVASTSLAMGPRASSKFSQYRWSSSRPFSIASSCTPLAALGSGARTRGGPGTIGKLWTWMALARVGTASH